MSKMVNASIAVHVPNSLWDRMGSNDGNPFFVSLGHMGRSFAAWYLPTTATNHSVLPVFGP